MHGAGILGMGPALHAAHLEASSCVHACPKLLHVRRLQVPLMRNPANKERLCVNCDAVHPDGAPLDSAGDDNAAPAEESAAPSTDQPAAAASAPVSKPRPQPSLHRTVNGDENDAEDGAAGSLAAASTGKAKEDAEAARERSDRSADLIAERLVKGWALTDKYCPR